MKKIYMVGMVSALLLTGCGQDVAYEKQPFPDLPDSVPAVEVSRDPNLLPVIESEPEPPVDGIIRPPRGPIGTLEERHPELFE